MIDKVVPWWRRALDFALSGIRSGFGLFRRNGRMEASPEVEAGNEVAAVNLVPLERIDREIAAPELATLEIAEPEFIEREIAEPEMIEPEDSAPAVAETEIKEPEDEKLGAAEPELMEAELVAGEVKISEEEHTLKDSSPQSESAATKAEQDAKIVAAPEAAHEPAGANAVSEAVPRHDVSVPAEAVTVRDQAPLPFAEAPHAERTTAEKVAAALKARGEDAEQSPFSVIVSQVYDGPLDLLLDLIRKQDIDIYDIPIAKITAQFLAYVDQLKAGDMDVAGEFIYTAALLIHIKSKMLLPRAPAGPEDAVEDPRRELVERLLEHERFKNAAQMLLEKQMLEAATWTNPGGREFREDAGAEPEIAADTVDLVRVFRDILDRARNRPVLNLEEDSVTVGQMIQFLARRLTMEDKPVALRSLLNQTRSERALIAMFLALLEMVRLQAILLRQDRQFSEIFIKKHSGFEAIMDQGLANARDDWR
jgi:segregation and condensation protein A